MQMVKAFDVFSCERLANHNVKVYVSCTWFILRECYGPVQVCTHQVLPNDCEQFVAKLFHELLNAPR